MYLKSNNSHLPFQLKDRLLNYLFKNFGELKVQNEFLCAIVTKIKLYCYNLDTLTDLFIFYVLSVENF